MNPSVTFYVILVAATQVVFWIQGNKGMRNYFTFLAGGTVLQFYIRNPIVWEFITVLIVIRAFSTIFGLMSKKWRESDNFPNAVKSSFVGVFVDVALFKVEMIDVRFLYFVFELATLIIITLYFVNFKFSISRFSVRLFNRDLFPVPRSISVAHEWVINDLFILIFGLYALWFVGMTILAPVPITQEYWRFHHLVSVAQISLFLIIGLKQIVWKSRENLV